MKTELSADEERLGRLEGTEASLLKKKEGLKKHAVRWRSERDRLNETVRSLRARAFEEKEKRDKLNQRVAEIKRRIEELHRELDAKRERLTLFDEELVNGTGRLPPRRELERDLRRIEWELSTTPTLEMREREADLTERARELRRALEVHEKLDALDDRRLITLADVKSVEVEARRSRDEMKELHEASQEYHERMIQLYKKADEEMKKADEAHNIFLEGVSAIKEIDAELVKVMEEVRNLRQTMREADRLIASKRDEAIEERKRELVTEARRRLEAGEKLSLEMLKLIYGEEKA